MVMQPSTPLPDADVVRLEHLATEVDPLTAVVSGQRAEVTCPERQQPAKRAHSRYRRCLAARPWNGVRVRLRVTSRRWFCDHPECSRRIFAERLPGLTLRYGHRTDDQAQLPRLLAYALGGEAGSRAGLGAARKPAREFAAYQRNAAAT